MIRPFFPIALVLTLLIVSPADACCVWDRDTLASEAAGAPDLIEVIVGKIDRFPKKYYEIREKRLVEMAAANDPVRFDDLAICLLKIRADAEHWDTLALRKLDEKDRLVAKLIADNALPESDSRTHYYRSNISGAMVITLDTFEVMAKSSKAANSDPIRYKLMSASERIAAAAKNGTLFTGDKYLQRFVDWLRTVDTAGDSLLPDFLNLRHANKTALEPNDQLKTRGLEDYIAGLTGLIRSAPEFENVDVFYALSLALAVNGQQSLAHMARLRAYDIIDAGGKSLVPGAPTGEQLKLQITPRKPEGGQMVDMMPLSKEMRASIEADYKKLRARVSHWQADRTEYITARLNKGEHPDTHPDFWNAWAEAPLVDFQLASGAQPEAPRPVAQPQKDVIKGGIPAANTPEADRIAIGGLQVHWIGLVIAAVVVIMLGLALTLAAMRKRGHDNER